MTTPVHGFCVVFACPACLAERFPFAPPMAEGDELVMGMRACPVGLDCVDDFVTDGFDLVETDEPGVFYLLCPHEEETSRPFREADPGDEGPNRG